MNIIQRPKSDLRLLRLDNCTWSYQRKPGFSLSEKRRVISQIDEVRIITPELGAPGQAYEMALIVGNALQSRKIFFQMQKNGSLYFEVQKHHSSLNGRWSLTLESARSWNSRMLDWIPFIKKYPPHHFISIRVTRMDQQVVPAFVNKIKQLVVSPKYLLFAGRFDYSPIQCSLHGQQSFVEHLQSQAFSDPYTRIATEALQSVETDYVSERSIKGSCRLVIGSEGQLKVDLISIRNEPIENQRTVRAYRDFLIDEYGQEYVDYAQYEYGIHFKEMIDLGLPLLPDHVFKMNIGVNNIEMQHLENLYLRLSALRQDLSVHPMQQPIEKVLEYYHQKEAPVHFCMRELRKLLEVAGPTIQSDADLKEFLDRFIGNLTPDHIPHLMPEQFNALIAMVWPTTEEMSRALTGRQITHLAICGYKTMGDPNEPDPVRDQAELMQIFPDLEKCDDWDNFFELLSHVVVKKNLFREYPAPNDKSVWHAGVIIPAPETKDHKRRWYCVCKVSDNGEGNMNYILLPAVKGFQKDNRSMPMINLYRSTNSNRNAIDSMGSIENDLNPISSPGSLGEIDPKARSGGFFFNRTVPLWVAMMIHGDHQSNQDAIFSYREALDEFQRSIKDNDQYLSVEKTNQMRVLRNSDNLEELRAFLLKEAEKRKELPKYKRSQDLIFIGHSLGGALAQRGLHYFGPGLRRLPCPGNHFSCRSYNGPATDSAVDFEFMKFGRKNRELIKGLGQHWKIFHQLEYGDFVPEAGESHLGTHDYNEEYDEEWLDVHVHIFRPLTSAHSLAITTCPTHGRRIGEATVNFDYRLSFLSPKELFEYHHKFFLPKKLKKEFGYQILVSPRITEIMRRVIGFVATPLIHLGTSISHQMYSEGVHRNAQGMFSCEYRAVLLPSEHRMAALQKSTV